MVLPERGAGQNGSNRPSAAVGLRHAGRDADVFVASLYKERRVGSGFLSPASAPVQFCRRLRHRPSKSSLFAAIPCDPFQYDRHGRAFSRASRRIQLRNRLLAASAAAAA